MNKVVNINLGGKKFTIDEDAFQVLDKYLNTINNHFSKSQGFEDIMYDIEIRLSELFEEAEGYGGIVSVKQVDQVMKIMGSPSDFGANESNAKSQKNMNSHANPKRLFRDPENKVIAGVASGLAAYMGIQDPLIVRLGFVFFLCLGIGILPYILLWALVPKALTASDRLAMKGEKININTIGKNIEDGFEDIKETLEDLHKNFKEKVF